MRGQKNAEMFFASCIQRMSGQDFAVVPVAVINCQVLITLGSAAAQPAGGGWPEKAERGRTRDRAAGSVGAVHQ